MSEVTEVLVPQMNPNDEHAVLVSWHVASGAWVDAEQPIATLETTKATFDVTAPVGGYAFFEHAPKSTVAVGSAIAWISATPDQGSVPHSTPGNGASREPAPADEARFTRKALKRMKELGLQPEDFRSTERVDIAAVERVARNSGTQPVRRFASPESAQELEQSSTKIIEVQMLSKVYRQIVPSAVTIALSARKVNEALGKMGEGSGAPSLLERAVYETARLLEDFPELNGFYGDGRAWHYPVANIGFAINVGRGLRVPVVKRVAQLSLIETCRAVRDLSLRYMRSELTYEDLTGGSFTITDLSGAGVHHFIPVLNDKQAAILGICAEHGETGYRDLVLTFDHRMSDGMRVAAFLSELKTRLEATPASA